MFRRMLDHPGIELRLSTDFVDVRPHVAGAHIVFTGPIDAYFDYCFGPLPYRSLRFEYEHLPHTRYYQAVGTVNYPNDHAFTRITEFKHLTGQEHDGTSIVREYPSAQGEPYYPVPRPQNEELYRRYVERAAAEAERDVRRPARAVPLLQHGPGRGCRTQGRTEHPAAWLTVAVVNIVVPAIKRRTFSGGIACIFEYAKGLTARGHEVNVLPLLPSPYPQWVQGNFGRLVSAPHEPSDAAGVAAKEAVREFVACSRTARGTSVPARSAARFPAAPRAQAHAQGRCDAGDVVRDRAAGSLVWHGPALLLHAALRAAVRSRRAGSALARARRLRLPTVSGWT